jgi:Tol biopolymer transport system component
VDINAPGERDLTWKDWCQPGALSDDGRTLAFGNRGANGRTLGYIRRTDGSPAVLLSEAGNPVAISPDGQWVVTMSPSTKGWTVVPIGVGESRHVAVGQLAGLSRHARWLPDAQRIVYVGSEAGRPRRVFIQNLSAGSPVAVTPEGTFGPLVVSPDSTLVVARNEKEQLSKYPVNGGTPAVLAGALRGDEPLAWSPDGDSIWVLDRNTRPAKIFRLERRTGRRTLWRDVPYSDPAATPESLRVVMSADGSKFVYAYVKYVSELYVAEGLR